ncbi:hypothetical protein Trydic_g13648 [Trypoxylus dichotomus]
MGLFLPKLPPEISSSIESTYDCFVQHVRRTIDRFRRTIDRLTEEVIADINQRIGINLSVGTCPKACKKVLHLHPYQISVTYELLRLDFLHCIQYCEWFNEALNNDDIMIDITFFNDEAWCHLKGYVNSQNNRI